MGPTRPGDAAANRAVMDRIAAPFDATRKVSWPQVLAFLDGMPAGERLLDLGGGNGRHSVAAGERGLRPLLLDVSGGLLRRARTNLATVPVRSDLVEADATRLPLRDGAVRHALFIAALHCIRGRATRIAALRELRRVLTPGGAALVSVWSAGQERFRATVAAQREAPQTLAEGDEVGDVLVPWARGTAEPVPRFYHVYEEDELRDELRAAGWQVEAIEGARIADRSAVDNWFATVRAP